MDYRTLEYIKENGIGTVTLNRPERLNAFDTVLAEELYEVLTRMALDGDVRCVILKGKGKAFCAGGDVKEMHAARDKPGFLRDLTIGIHKCVMEIRSMEKPVIAGVNGAAYGAGLSLALACDLVIAVRTARMNTAFIGIGLAPGCGTKFMTELVGYHKAAEMVLLSKPFTAEEAERMGIVNAVVDEDELDSALETLAERFMSLPPIAVGLAKMLLNESMRNDLASHLTLESMTAARSAATQDFAEGVKAFVEKRKPVFKGI